MLGILLISFAPGLVWLWYFERYDKYDREPRHLLAKTFLWGMLMVIPAVLIEMPFRAWLEAPPNLFATFFLAFFVVGLTEEGAKLVAVLISPYRTAHFNEGLDGIIYAITAGLGFAAVENVFYVMSFGPQVALPRGIIAFLAHASFAGVMGFYLGKAKFSSRPGWLILKGLAIAAFFHGLYDFILLSGILPPWTAIAFVLAVYGLLIHKIRLAQLNSPFRPS